MAPDRLEAHAGARRVLVGLERDDAGVLVEHPVGVQLLRGLVRLDVDVDAVADEGPGVPDLRLIALRVQLERELQVRLRLPPVRVQVGRLELERRARLEQPARVVGEDVGVAPHLVDREPGGVGGVGPLGDHRSVGHVVEDVAPAHGVAGAVGRDVVELLHLDGGDVAVLGEPDGDGPEVGPLVGAGGGHGDQRRLDDQVGLADLPLVLVTEVDGRGHVRGVAERRAGVDPAADQLDLLLAQRDVVLVVLDADVALDEPRGHRAALVAQSGPGLDGPRVGAHLGVGEQRHRGHRRGPVALLAALLEDRRDVPRERDLAVRRSRLGARGDRGHEQETDDAGDQKSRNTHGAHRRLSFEDTGRPHSNRTR